MQAYTLGWLKIKSNSRQYFHLEFLQPFELQDLCRRICIAKGTSSMVRTQRAADLVVDQFRGAETARNQTGIMVVGSTAWSPSQLIMSIPTFINEMTVACLVNLQTFLKVSPFT